MRKGRNSQSIAKIYIARFYLALINPHKVLSNLFPSTWITVSFLWKTFAVTIFRLSFSEIGGNTTNYLTIAFPNIFVLWSYDLLVTKGEIWLYFFIIFMKLCYFYINKKAGRHQKWGCWEKWLCSDIARNM